MCAAAGVHFRETATGFKWLCRPGLEHPGWHQVLLYEEALGYAVGPGVRDKDGIAAAVVLLDALGHQQTLGRGLPDVLDDLARAHGAFVTSNGSVRTSRERLDAAFAAPRTSLGGRRVVDADRPAADVLRWFLDDDTRVVVAVGDQPKVKYYCRRWSRSVGTATSRGQAGGRGAARAGGRGGAGPARGQLTRAARRADQAVSPSSASTAPVADRLSRRAGPRTASQSASERRPPT